MITKKEDIDKIAKLTTNYVLTTSIMKMLSDLSYYERITILQDIILTYSSEYEIFGKVK